MIEYKVQGCEVHALFLTKDRGIRRYSLLWIVFQLFDELENINFYNTNEKSKDLGIQDVCDPNNNAQS